MNRVIFDLRKLETLTEENKTATFENNKKLFEDAEYMLINRDINIEERKEIARLLLEIFNVNLNLEKDITLFPIMTQMLYNADNELKIIELKFEEIKILASCHIDKFMHIYKEYRLFLEKEMYELFFELCYSKLDDFNNELYDYINLVDELGTSYKSIINPEVYNWICENKKSLD